MKNVRWIDHLKLRASYGLVGNDQMGSTRFAYLQYYTSGSNMNIYFGEDKKAFGTTLIEGIFANPSLTWEKARKFNFGIDAEFFHQRLTLSVDVFKEHRYDILTSLNTDDKLGFPYIVGQTAPIVNSGIVDNRGIEFQLGWDGRIGQHFRYWIRPNFTFARNKVKFCNEISYIDNNGRDCPWRYQTGRRVGENFCYIFDHFVADQDEADRLNAMNGGSGFAIWGPVQPGDVVYKDMNGDGVVNNYDRAAVGNPRTPEIQYGIPVGLSYKGFDFSMLWQALCKMFRMFCAKPLNRRLPNQKTEDKLFLWKERMLGKPIPKKIFQSSTQSPPNTSSSLTTAKPSANALHRLLKWQKQRVIATLTP